MSYFEYFYMQGRGRITERLSVEMLWDLCLWTTYNVSAAQIMLPFPCVSGFLSKEKQEKIPRKNIKLRLQRLLPLTMCVAELVNLREELQNKGFKSNPKTANWQQEQESTGM